MPNLVGTFFWVQPFSKTLLTFKKCSRGGEFYSKEFMMKRAEENVKDSRVRLDFSLACLRYIITI